MIFIFGLKNIKIKNGDRILDIGCGDGNYKIISSNESWGEIIGVDKNHALINLARKNLN